VVQVQLVWLQQQEQVPPCIVCIHDTFEFSSDAGINKPYTTHRLHAETVLAIAL